MAQYKIQASAAVPGKFEGVDESGKLFFEGKAYYDSKSGLKQAISKSKNGHTYVDPEAEAESKAKAKPKPAKKADMETRDTIPAPAPAQVSTLSDDAILELHEKAKRAAGYRPLMAYDDFKKCDWSKATTVAKEGGFEHYRALKKKANGIRHGRKSPEVRAHHEAVTERRKARKANKGRKSEKETKTWEDSVAYKKGYTRELCEQVHSWVCQERERGNTDSLAEMAETHGHDVEAFESAFRVGRAIKKQRSAAANECARLHGFNTKRPYRACKRAAANGDTFAALVREVCVQVAQGKQALPKQPVIRKAG